MEVLRPASLDEALALRRARPDAVPIAGGTDVMALLNRGRLRPPALLDLSRLEELRGWAEADGGLRLGASLTYSELAEPPLAGRCPALAEASRAVGSPQIRNRGTLGGCLVGGAGDAVPALLVERAEVELGSGRTVPLEELLREGLPADELVAAVRVRPARRESFAKIGRRNGFAPTVAAVAVAVDGDEVRAAAAGPGIPARLVTGDAAGAAERLAACSEDAYLSHALGVLVRRALAA